MSILPTMPHYCAAFFLTDISFYYSVKLVHSTGVIMTQEIKPDAREGPSKTLERIEADLQNLLRSTEISLLRLNNTRIDLISSDQHFSPSQKKRIQLLADFIDNELSHIKAQRDFLESQSARASTTRLDVIK